ncbi:MAG: YetF domain-containing protein [Geitlerinemataceae cyanobacterium]
MLDSVTETMSWMLGLDAQQLTWWQMGWRAAIIYLAAWVMVRVGGDRRFLGTHAAIDVILSIMLGSTLSRAINGSAPYFPTIAAAIVLVAMHWLLAATAFHFELADRIIKGSSRILIRDGQVKRQAMKTSHISQQDLESALRLKAKLRDLEQVDVARLESSGEISVLTKEKPPRVFEVKVEDGVKTVRIEFD